MSSFGSRAGFVTGGDSIARRFRGENCGRLTAAWMVRKQAPRGGASRAGASSWGIAAYKAAELCRLFVKAGATVKVVMTEAATRFIAPLTLQTLSGAPVAL